MKIPWMLPNSMSCYTISWFGNVSAPRSVCVAIVKSSVGVSAFFRFLTARTLGRGWKKRRRGRGEERVSSLFSSLPPPPLLSSQRSRVQPRPQKTSTETLASQATPRSITFILFQTRPVVISSFLFGQIAFGLNSLITSFIFCLLFVA